MFRRTKSETTAVPATEPTDERPAEEGAAHAVAQGGRGRRQGPRQGAPHPQGDGRRAEAPPAASRAPRCGRPCAPATTATCPPATRVRSTRFIRDYVDSRFSFIELMIPLMLVVPDPRLDRQRDRSRSYAQPGDAARHARADHRRPVRLRFRLRRELDRALPREPTKGTTYYAIARSMQMRFMRLPKTQVKIGQQLPERYR